MTRIAASAQRNLPVAVVAAFLAGLFVGLVVLGWWLWPVQWTDARPADLQEAWRRTYLLMVADSYAQNADAEQARQRLVGLEGPGRSAAQIGRELQMMANAHAAAQDAESAARLQALAPLVHAPSAQPAEPGTGDLPVGTQPQADLVTRLLRVCGLVILVLVILAGLLLLVYFLQSRTAGAPSTPVRIPTPAPAGNARPPAFTPRATAPPRPREPAEVEDIPPPMEAVAEGTAIGPFVATYNLGDIDFDMSFGIESPNGDFLGECGLGMAEIIGGGDVQRVTAFEVWLFDKTDIRTVSLVLASTHAHMDPALRTKLASRGEVVLAQPGVPFSVKTSSLKLGGRVLDLAYGGGDVPAQSYFTSFSVELVPEPLGPGRAE
jgi:hypothetical protein